jgi:hypothetical protein
VTENKLIIRKCLVGPLKDVPSNRVLLDDDETTAPVTIIEGQEKLNPSAPRRSVNSRSRHEGRTSAIRVNCPQQIR